MKNISKVEFIEKKSMYYFKAKICTIFHYSEYNTAYLVTCSP